MFVSAWLVALLTGGTAPYLFQTQSECQANLERLHGARCFNAEVIVTPGLVFPPDQKYWWIKTSPSKTL